MDVSVDSREGPDGTLYDLRVLHTPREVPRRQFLYGLTEHDLRDLESELARRRAMGRICPEKDQEHTCSLPPGHLGYAAHVCRACTYHWSGTTFKPGSGP